MEDTKLNVVLDSSLLSAYLLPSTVDNKDFLTRINNLVNAKVKWYWPTLRLWAPSMVIAETQSTIDKWRFCDWHGPIKKDRKKRISKNDHQLATELLQNLLASRSLELIEHSARHTLATSLVSSVNAKYQIRRNTKKKKGGRKAPPVRPPMGAADCFIIASAISLKLDLSTDMIIFATADQRQCDVANRLRSLSFDQANELDLEKIAKSLGTVWTPYIYPRAINLRSASASDLCQCFHSWPLPGREWVPHLDHFVLADKDIASLKNVWFQIKNEYGIGIDSLPYSAAIDDIRCRFADLSGVYIGNLEIYKLLQGWRKSGQLKAESI